MRKPVWAVLTLLALTCAVSAGPDLRDDWASRVKQVKLTLAEAIDTGMSIAGSGTVFAAELEEDKGALVYSIDVAQGTKTRNVVLDAKTGAIVEDVVEDDDHSKPVEASKKIGVKAGIEAAVKALPGTPFYAVLRVREGAPAVGVVLVDAQGKVQTVIVDGTTGVATVKEASKAEKSPADREFTDRFPEDKADLGPTGRNTYFILEPGWSWVLEGTDDGKPMTVTSTTVDATRKIDGVECRAIEVREVVGGVLKEVTLDYYAISRRTGNVYYFGEAVDIYEGDKVVSHEGAWMAGEAGCRYGLMVPAVPLIGERYYQEIAPGIAMDRAETLSTTAVVETKAGTFKDVLHLEETNPEEPGHTDHKYYAPGIGLVKEEENLVLVRYGRK